MEGQARESAAGDAQPFLALIAGRVTTARGAREIAAQSPAMCQERAAVPVTVPAAAAPPADGSRWLLVPIVGRPPASVEAAGSRAASTGAILGVRIAYQDGRFSVEPGWTSQNIAAPLTPIVVNGVAFAASGASNAPAGLYALNGATGKTLWQSEKTIASPLSGRSFWVGSGHVFVGTRDGAVYAFGFAMERK